jgi:hypothetical protein
LNALLYASAALSFVHGADFMGLFISVTSEHVGQKVEDWGLPLALAMGAGSLLWWAIYDDLRLYGWIQFFPLFAVAAILVMFPAAYPHRSYLAYCLPPCQIRGAFRRRHFRHDPESVRGAYAEAPARGGRGFLDIANAEKPQAVAVAEFAPASEGRGQGQNQIFFAR